MKAQAGPSLWSGWNAGELVAFGDLCLDLSQRRASTKKLLPPALRCKHPICTLHSAPTSASPADGVWLAPSAPTLRTEQACVPPPEGRASPLFLRKIDMEDITREDHTVMRGSGVSYEISVVCSLQSQVQGKRKNVFVCLISLDPR